MRKIQWQGSAKRWIMTALCVTAFGGALIAARRLYAYTPCGGDCKNPTDCVVNCIMCCADTYDMMADRCACRKACSQTYGFGP